MKLIKGETLTRHAVWLLVFALAVPLLNGCSQLGIAKADDVTAMETRLSNENKATNSRIDALEKNTGDMQKSLDEITTNLDSLKVRFQRAHQWLETMNLDTVTADARKASEAANLAAAQSKSFFSVYMAWIKSQYEDLGKQIADLEKAFPPDGSGKKAAGQIEQKKSTGSGDSGGGG
jgi:paraquat-inducible protein B